MKKTQFDLPELADIMNSVSVYQNLPNLLSNISAGKALEDWWNNILKSYRDKIRVTWDRLYQDWMVIDMHVIEQNWGNASGGWEGIGGAAMSKYYTICIINYNFKAGFIFYGGRLAYIFQLDAKAEIFINKQYQFPGRTSAKSNLNLIYLPQR